MSRHDSTTTEERFAAIIEAVGDQPGSLANAVDQVMQGAPTHLRTVDLDDPGDEIAVPDRSGDSDLERIVGDNNLLPVHFLVEGAEIQRAVARIALTSSYGGLPAGAGWGTGFLVGSSILMTNNHVIPSKSFAEKVRAEFNYQNEHSGAATTPDTWDLDPDDLFYTNATLDVTIVRVKSRSLYVRYPFTAIADDEEVVLHVDDADASPTLDPRIAAGVSSRIAGTFTRPPFLYPVWLVPGGTWGRIPLPTGAVPYNGNERYNVVQHPQGRRKEVALQSNTFSALYTNAVRYTSDTEPGSSGSPVFANDWDLVAIHHAGGSFVDGAWIDNEGMRMDRIVADLRTQFPVGSTVRGQLGI